MFLDSIIVEPGKTNLVGSRSKICKEEAGKDVIWQNGFFWQSGVIL